MILVFLGPPGAGKGTQAKVLGDKFGYRQISTGDILRQNRANKTALGAEAQSYMDSGKLVPDDLIIRMVEPELGTGGKVIFDGFPRTIPQAEALDALLASKGFPSTAIVFDVDYKVLTDRIAGRWSNPRTGRVYHATFNPPRTPGIDDDDGGELTQRPDDRAEVVAARLAEYDEKTKPVIAWYEKHDTTIHVDGLGEIDAVTKAILAALPGVAV